MQKRLNEINEELQQIESRAAEIRDAIPAASQEDLEKLNTELTEKESRKSDLEKEKADIEARMAEARQIAEGEVKANDITNRAKEKPKMITRDSKEYRDAFLAEMLGEATQEQRDALITTDNGIALPETIESKIWDLIHDAHPILDDITMFQTGTVLVVNQHKAITAGKAKKVAQGVANDLEENEFAKITLVGNDYSKTVELSYAASKMTQGALEQYLETEIAADLGEAMALDVFAQIKSDLGAAAVTYSGDAPTFAEINKAFGAAKRATYITVYCSNASKFALLGQVDKNGQPVFRDGVVLGAQIKVDSAAGDDIFALDAPNFEANMVQPIMIETDRDIKAHKIVYSGYARMQGAMRDVLAGAYLSKVTA